VDIFKLDMWGCSGWVVLVGMLRNMVGMLRNLEVWLVTTGGRGSVEGCVVLDCQSL
jgi:hypothetical protein